MPIFGNSVLGTKTVTRLAGRWEGLICQMNNEHGIARSITVAVLGSKLLSNRMRAAIYKIRVDEEERVRGTLLAQSEIRIITYTGDPQWETFIFPDPKPSLEPNEDYMLCLGGAEEANCYWVSLPNACDRCEGCNAFAVELEYQTEYSHAWPTNDVGSIYCMYEPAQGLTVTIQSTPINVPVKIDDIAVGTTPLSVTVNEGEHVISIPELTEG